MWPSAMPRCNQARHQLPRHPRVATFQVLEWATFIMATVAAVGSVVRVAQNERSYKLMRKSYKHMKKRKKK
jgi:hypothetical protein